MTSRGLAYPEWTVVHLPHDATRIPAAAREQIVLDDAELEREVVRMTDHRTREIFLAGAPAPVHVRAGVSRLVVDVERFEDDALESMAARGMGVIYTRDSHGRPLRSESTEAERRELLDAYYRPHHARLTEAVDRALERHGRCLVLDGHSFPSIALPYEPQKAARRPSICVGTDPDHTPVALRDAFLGTFRDAGFDTELDTPFAGALVPMKHYRRDTRVSAIMVEVNRGLYLDEATAEPRSTFDETAARIAECCRAAIARYSP